MADDWDNSNLDDTVRNLKVLSEAPGDLRFRQNIAASFEKVSEKLSKIETRLTRIEERLIPRTDIAIIAQKEMAVLASKVETLSRVVWGSLGASGSALVILAVSKVFGH